VPKSSERNDFGSSLKLSLAIKEVWMIVVETLSQMKTFCMRTNNVSWTSVGTKELSITFEGLAKIEEKRSAPLDANHGVGFAHLHGFSCPL
jgi:hypothetical protein